VFSVVGLGLSLWVNVEALLGKEVAPELLFWLLHFGIFVVWVPMVVAMQGKARGAGKVVWQATLFTAVDKAGAGSRRDFWNVAFEERPDWLRHMSQFFKVYAMFGIALSFVRFSLWEVKKDLNAGTWAFFSSGWLIFYSFAFERLFSGMIARGKMRKCTNGHLMPEGANYCTRCGQPVTNN